MNAWSLDKHKNLKVLLITLQAQLANNSFCVSGETDDNFNAVFLIKPEQPALRAYVFTYGQPPDKYGIHLEYPGPDDNNFNNSIQTYENMSLQQIVDALVMHFEISDYEMAV